MLVPAIVGLGPLLGGGRPPPGAVFLICGVGLIGGLSGGNRFGLDGTAIWVLIASGTDPRDGRRDLVGGDLALAATFGPVLVGGGWCSRPSVAAGPT